MWLLGAKQLLPFGKILRSSEDNYYCVKSRPSPILTEPPDNSILTEKGNPAEMPVTGREIHQDKNE
jgi:hypothetical protein